MCRQLVQPQVVMDAALKLGIANTAKIPIIIITKTSSSIVKAKRFI